jgi:hypothetical protein
MAFIHAASYIGFVSGLAFNHTAPYIGFVSGHGFQPCRTLLKGIGL